MFAYLELGMVEVEMMVKMARHLTKKEFHHAED